VQATGSVAVVSVAAFVTVILATACTVWAPLVQVTAGVLTVCSVVAVTANDE
jgi:hypothetical protein